MTAEQIKELTAILGPSRVSTDPETLDECAADKWLMKRLPEVVVFAEATGDVSKVLAFANSRGIPVTARGAGTGYSGGCTPLEGGIVLSLERMNNILEINPVDGVAVAQAGVITGDLQKAAREKCRFYPPDPQSFKECSIGGNVATNAGGPRCLKYGVTRTFVLGLEVVLADGEVMRVGGRTHKNKTGFDLVGIFTGSEGLLGVITEVIVRLIPRPPARATLSASFAEFRQAADAVNQVFGAGHLPSVLEIADKFTLQAARDYKGREVIPDGEAHLLVEFDGQPDAVRSEMAAVRKLVAGLGALTLEVGETEEESEGLWDLRRDFSTSLKATGLRKLNEDIVVPRSRLVDLVEFTEGLQKETGFPIACFGHAGDGNIHTNVMVDMSADSPDLRRRMDDTLDRLFRQVLAWNGVVSGEHGIGIAKIPWLKDGLDPVAARLHNQLKDLLDPNGILNPGKFLPIE